MMTSFRTTIAVLNQALSDTPRTSTTVTRATMRNAGRLKMIGKPAMCGASVTAGCRAQDARRQSPASRPPAPRRPRAAAWNAVR